MSKFMLSVGLVLASLAGLSGALLGATRAAKAADVRGAKPIRPPLPDARFSTYEIAVLMR